MNFETVKVQREGAVLFAEISAPPMNLLGPDLYRDLNSLIHAAEADRAIRVLVFRSTDPDYFISHVDVTRIKELREVVQISGGKSSPALLFHQLSQSRLITIAEIAGRVRGVGSEFVLALDMRFAARGKGIFGQFESAFDVIPGGGAAQHLTRLMGRARALEVMLSVEDYDADLAERYGWINRALPANELGTFVKALAHRIAALPAAGQRTIKDRVNDIALPPADELRRDAELFIEGLRSPDAQHRLAAALAKGFQTREAEMDLPRMLSDLA
ncbi:enoyl-CoA hydratase/isomerase family protein [Bradyrhizobium sp. DASA03068]|uniref:enoyl-CoA hydratase/isomerase family protein n=1 Tax=Bradyrhizobium sp. BLXBL-01 TaxID=3395915 RepID=UPI003F71E8CA